MNEKGSRNVAETHQRFTYRVDPPASKYSVAFHFETRLANHGERRQSFPFCDARLLFRCINVTDTD